MGLFLTERVGYIGYTNGLNYSHFSVSIPFSIYCDFAAFAVKVGSGESVSLPFESGMALQLALVNRMCQQWYCERSKARLLEALQLLLSPS